MARRVPLELTERSITTETIAVVTTASGTPPLARLARVKRLLGKLHLPTFTYDWPR